MDTNVWNLSDGDIKEIDSAQKELEAYEEFHQGNPKEDEHEQYETIRRNRAKEKY